MRVAVRQWDSAGSKCADTSVEVLVPGRIESATVGALRAEVASLLSLQESRLRLIYQAGARAKPEVLSNDAALLRYRRNAYADSSHHFILITPNFSTFLAS